MRIVWEKPLIDPTKEFFVKVLQEISFCYLCTIALNGVSLRNFLVILRSHELDKFYYGLKTSSGVKESFVGKNSSLHWSTIEFLPDDFFIFDSELTNWSVYEDKRQCRWILQREILAFSISLFVKVPKKVFIVSLSTSTSFAPLQKPITVGLETDTICFRPTIGG